jgi:hypothetical protein
MSVDSESLRRYFVGRPTASGISVGEVISETEVEWTTPTAIKINGIVIPVTDTARSRFDRPRSDDANGNSSIKIKRVAFERTAAEKQSSRKPTAISWVLLLRDPKVRCNIAARASSDATIVKLNPASDIAA